MSEIAVIGFGTGKREELTVEALDFIMEADMLIGARRMVEGAMRIREDRPCLTCESFRTDEMIRAAEEHPEADRIAVLFSGDTGFFSGAGAFLKAAESLKVSESLKVPESLKASESLKTETGMKTGSGSETAGRRGNIRVMPGISSVVAFCAKLGRSWQDLTFVSLHGKKAHIVSEVMHAPHVFVLLGSEDGAAEVCRKLCACDLKDAEVTLGENLGSENERILKGHPEDFSFRTGCALSVMLIDNPHACASPCAIPDDAFIRGKVPMTKEEVRTISVAKLRPGISSVIYDIGAGTGSVTVELAERAYRGEVYAIEKNPEAISLLKQNTEKFRTDNVHIVEGTAPDVIRDLPAPDRVFIGGSGGNLREILCAVCALSPSVRVVVNAITPETVAAAIEAFRTLDFSEPEILSVTVAKARKAGNVHLMTGQNPVYILTAEKIAEASGQDTRGRNRA